MLRTNPRPGEDLAVANTRRRGAIGWKTGTSFGFRDAWAVGVFGRFALGVWVGNFDGAPNPAFVGREAAGPLLFSIADALRAAGEPEGPPAPPHPLSLVRAPVCALSGAIPGAFCPGHKDTWLIPGISPIATCSVHREVSIDARTGLRACPGRSEGVRRAVYEFWPSHLLALFRSVGIARRTPPPFAPDCVERSAAGLALKIESPQAHVVYALRDGQADEIPLSAVSDADGRRVSWFIDDAFVGRSEPGGSLFWRARPGHFVLRAIDELGRSRTQPLEVTLVSDGRSPRP
jgi:penicillin-binding protein 1C